MEMYYCTLAVIINMKTYCIDIVHANIIVLLALRLVIYEGIFYCVLNEPRLRQFAENMKSTITSHYKGGVMDGLFFLLMHIFNLENIRNKFSFL